jgi:hypothetical protein
VPALKSATVVSVAAYSVDGIVKLKTADVVLFPAPSADTTR